MQAHLYAPMLRSRLVTCGGVVLPSRRTGRPGTAVRGRRIRILRTGVLPVGSGGGAGRRRLERIIVLPPFPGLELHLLQVWWRYSLIYSANKNRFMFKHACMVITAWNDLYPGDLPLLEISSSIIDRSARHSRLAGASASCPGNTLYQGACFLQHLSNGQEKKPKLPNPPTHGVSTAKQILHLALGTVCLVSLSMTVFLLYFHSLQPPLAYFYYSLPEFVPTSLS